MRRVEFGTWNPFLGGGRSISLFANPNEHDLSTLIPLVPYDQSNVSFAASKEKGGSKLVPTGPSKASTDAERPSIISIDVSGFFREDSAIKIINITR